MLRFPQPYCTSFGNTESDILVLKLTCGRADLFTPFFLPFIPSLILIYVLLPSPTSHFPFFLYFVSLCPLLIYSLQSPFLAPFFFLYFCLIPSFLVCEHTSLHSRPTGYFLRSSQHVMKLPSSVETCFSSPYSQKLATRPYP